MNSKEYVLNHDFGYGREPELENLIKLKLRNYEDVKIYIEWSIREIFSAIVNEQNEICFLLDNKKVKLDIELL